MSLLDDLRCLQRLLSFELLDPLRADGSGDLHGNIRDNLRRYMAFGLFLREKDLEKA